MPKNGPLNTPFESPLMSTPDPGESSLAGMQGGYPMDSTVPQGSSAGLVTSPFENPIMSPRSDYKETPNTSGMGQRVDQVGGLKDDPGRGATVAVAGGVATPNTPAGNIDKQ